MPPPPLLGIPGGNPGHPFFPHIIQYGGLLCDPALGDGDGANGDGKTIQELATFFYADDGLVTLP